MAISAVTASATTAGQTSGTSFTISSPAGTTAGDVLVCVVGERAASSESVSAIAASGGGSPFTNLNFVASSTGNAALTVWYRVVQAGDPTTWTITCSVAAEAILQAYRGVDNTTPVDALGSTNSGTASPGTFNSVTTLTASAWYVGGFGQNTASAPLSALSSGSPTPTIRGNAGNGGATNTRQGAALIDVAEASAGATGTFAYTLSAPTTGWGSYSFALRPAPTDPFPLAYAAGTLERTLGAVYRM